MRCCHRRRKHPIDTNRRRIGGLRFEELHAETLQWEGALKYPGKAGQTERSESATPGNRVAYVK